MKKNKGLNISTGFFLIAIAIIFVLMICTYVLTLVIPGGEYARVVDEAGNTVIAPDAEFKYVDGGISFFRWLASPLLVLGADGGGTIIAIIAFLLIIGGVFNCLDKCHLMKYMLEAIVHRFGHAKYKLLAIITFFFMAMGAFIGSFEECVPLVPIVVSLSVTLGWDALTGMGMSLLAIGCGFASGVCNPFTVGVAQNLAGLPMFSGIWLRAVSFVVIYFLLLVFLIHHAKKVDKKAPDEDFGSSFEADAKMNRALVFFASILGVGMGCVLLSGFIPALQDLTMIIVALTFLIAGIVSTLLTGTKAKEMGSSFWYGLVSILPAVILILTASSVRYAMTEGKILDTILHGAITVAGDLPKWAIILFIYLIVLVMNFFISSGSAKAFLLMPLIVPMAQVFGISSQLCVMAFAFGDGFSNVFYPTNTVLLVSLGIADVSYGKWVKYSWKFQLINIVITSLLLLFGFAVGYC